jgi:hypothetical protein
VRKAKKITRKSRCGPLKLPRELAHYGIVRPHVLLGWQAIADFLSVSERTARAWGKKYGLPYRYYGPGRVVSLDAEILIWLRTLDNQLRRKQGLKCPNCGHRLTGVDLK